MIWHAGRRNCIWKFDPLFGLFLFPLILSLKHSDAEKFCLLRQSTVRLIHPFPSLDVSVMLGCRRMTRLPISSSGKPRYHLTHIHISLTARFCLIEMKTDFPLVCGWGGWRLGLKTTSCAKTLEKWCSTSITWHLACKKYYLLHLILLFPESYHDGLTQNQCHKEGGWKKSCFTRTKFSIFISQSAQMFLTWQRIKDNGCISVGCAGKQHKWGTVQMYCNVIDGSQFSGISCKYLWSFCLSFEHV